MIMRGARQIWDIIQQTIKEWQEDDGSLLAAAVAYYSAFSFFPLLLVLTTALGLVLRVSTGAQDAQNRLLALVAQNSSPAVAQQIGNIMGEAQSDPGASGPIGLAMLLLGAMGIFGQIDSALDRIWDIPAAPAAGIVATIRRTLYERFSSFLMLLGLGALLVVAFITGLALSAARALSENVPGSATAWPVVQILAGIALNTVAFGLIYRVLPKSRVRWADAWRGGLIVAVTWELGRQALALLIVGTKYDAYGLIGSFIAIMAWIYYGATIFFLGAELVQVLCQRREGRVQDNPK